MKAMVAGGMHYIRSGDGSEELYSLEADPEERMNVAGFPDAQEALQGFRDALRSMLRRHHPPGGVARTDGISPRGDGRVSATVSE